MKLPAEFSDTRPLEASDFEHINAAVQNLKVWFVQNGWQWPLNSDWQYKTPAQSSRQQNSLSSYGFLLPGSSHPLKGALCHKSNLEAHQSIFLAHAHGTKDRIESPNWQTLLELIQTPGTPIFLRADTCASAPHQLNWIGRLFEAAKRPLYLVYAPLAVPAWLCRFQHKIARRQLDQNPSQDPDHVLRNSVQQNVHEAIFPLHESHLPTCLNAISQRKIALEGPSGRYVYLKDFLTHLMFFSQSNQADLVLPHRIRFTDQKIFLSLQKLLDNNPDLQVFDWILCDSTYKYFRHAVSESSLSAHNLWFWLQPLKGFKQQIQSLRQRLPQHLELNIIYLAEEQYCKGSKIQQFLNSNERLIRLHRPACVEPRQLYLIRDRGSHCGLIIDTQNPLEFTEFQNSLPAALQRIYSSNELYRIYLSEIHQILLPRKSHFEGIQLLNPEI